MTDTTIRVRLKEATRLNNTASGNPRWRLLPEEAGVLETEPDSQVSFLQFDGWVGKDVWLRVNGSDKVVDAHLLNAARPECRCCGGAGEHGYRAYAGGRSPEDTDAPCTACDGRGETWHETRLNSCSGYRSLQRGRR